MRTHPPIATHHQQMHMVNDQLSYGHSLLLIPELVMASDKVRIPHGISVLP